MAVQAGQGVGLVIRGGSEYGLGIYVTGVDNQSAAENAGLKVCSILPLGFLKNGLSVIHRLDFCLFIV